MKNSEIERVAPVKLLQKSWLIWFLLGLVLTVAILPVHSGALRQSESLLPVQLVQQGKKHYDTEQFQKAVEDLKEAAKAFENQGDKLNQAITLSNLSLAYQQLGEFLEAERAIAKTWQLLEFKPSEGISAISPQQLKILAPALNIHGRLEYIRGKPEVALGSWQLAVNIYQKLGNEEQAISSQINQVQALQTLGLYYQGKAIIEQVQQALEQLPPSLQIQGWQSLGEVLGAVGDLEGSRQFLNRSLRIAQNLNSPQDISSTFLSLGNTFWSLGNLERDRQSAEIKSDFRPWHCGSERLSDQALKFYKDAIQAYQQSFETLPSSSTGIKAQVNRLNLLVETEQFTEAVQEQREIALYNLPPSRTKVYAQINLAHNGACLRQKLNFSNNVPSWEEIDNLLKEAVQDAKKLEDKNSLSYEPSQKVRGLATNPEFVPTPITFL